MTRILIVDDEKNIRLLLRAFLASQNYMTEVAEDAKSAQLLLQSGTFDIVISDIVLPAMSGVELMHFVRKFFPRVQVILMTGMPSIESAAEAVRAGAFDYLIKPIGREAILRSVANATRFKALEDERMRLAEQNREYAERLEQMVQERTDKLRESESRYRRLFETAKEGLMILDAATGVVVDDLLDISKLEAGKTTLHRESVVPKPFDPDEVLQKVRNALKKTKKNPA